MSHKLGGRLPLLSARPAVTPATLKRAATNFVPSAGAQGLRVEFDRQCSTERRHDPLTLLDSNARIVSVRSGRGRVCLEPDLQNILRFVLSVL